MIRTKEDLYQKYPSVASLGEVFFTYTHLFSHLNREKQIEARMDLIERLERFKDADSMGRYRITQIHKRNAQEMQPHYRSRTLLQYLAQENHALEQLTIQSLDTHQHEEVSKYIEGIIHILRAEIDFLSKDDDENQNLSMVFTR